MTAKTVASCIIAVVIIAVVMIAIPGASGQLQVRREYPVTQAPSPEHVRLSSGPFVLPTNAAMVDWLVVNDSTTSQSITVTVFKLDKTAKTIVPPGALTATVAPGGSTHNMNEVGAKGPFQALAYYEVVVEGNSRNLLPTVNVWSPGTVMPGTSIPAGSWVRLQ